MVINKIVGTHFPPVVLVVHAARCVLSVYWCALVGMHYARRELPTASLNNLPCRLCNFLASLSSNHLSWEQCLGVQWAGLVFG